MNEVKSLIAEIKSKGLLRAGDKLELLYVVAAQLQDDYAAIKVERDALAAENVALKVFINQSCYSYDGDGSDVCDSYVGADESPFFPKTPATDAYLNAVRADGADKVAEYHFVRIDALKEVSRQGHLFHKAAYSDAVNVARLFRAGKDGE